MKFIKYLITIYLVTFCLCHFGCSSEETPNSKTSEFKCASSKHCPTDLICVEEECIEPGEFQCRDDHQCLEGERCIRDRCIPIEEFVCYDDIKKPILDVDPDEAEVDFGFAAVGERISKTVTIENIGDCILNVNRINFVPETSIEFTCSGCYDPIEKNSIQLLPWDKYDITVTYSPFDEGLDEGYLAVASDDPNEPLLFIHLKSSYKGIPKIKVEPELLDFGFVAVGEQSSKSFQIMNDLEDNGENNAVLKISDMGIDPISNRHFTLEPERELPVLLTPGEVLNVNLTYAPIDSRIDEVLVVIGSSDEETPIFELPVTAESLVPPDIVVSTSNISFGEVQVGDIVRQTITVQNQGGADLAVGLRLAHLSSTDYSYSPSQIGSISSGGRVDLLVDFHPTTIGYHNAELLINSNDPDQGEVIVGITGTGTEGEIADVVKIEMTFENGSDSAVDSDFRNVNLHYESPYGHDCSINDPFPEWDSFGHPKWMAFGVKEEPERVIHTDPGETEGDYKIWIEYIEDCSSIPLSIVAELMGLSVEMLIRYLSEGLINVNGIGDIIANTCFSRDGSNVHVKVFIGGNLVNEKTVHLNNAGEMANVLTLRRANGSFTVVE